MGCGAPRVKPRVGAPAADASLITPTKAMLGIDGYFFFALGGGPSVRVFNESLPVRHLVCPDIPPTQKNIMLSLIL